MVLIPLSTSPNAPGIVIGLKYDASPEDALAQIRERGYARFFGNNFPATGILLCGIAYDPKTKQHACKIECG